MTTRTNGGNADFRHGGLKSTLLNLCRIVLRPRYGRTAMTVVTVSGDSMAPALQDGDRVLVKRLPCRHVRNGDVVVVESPTTVVQGELAEPYWATSPPPGPPDPPGTRNWIIKRVSAIAGDAMPSGDPGRTEKPAVPPGHLFVLGDNPAASFDSRHFGPLPGSRMLGVVVRKLHL